MECPNFFVIVPYGKANNLDFENTFLWDQPIDRLRIYRPLPSLIGQFLHENWSIKIEILGFLGIFSRFFNMLLWPDPRYLFLLSNPHEVPIVDCLNLMFGGAIKFGDSRMKYATLQNCSFVTEQRDNWPILPKVVILSVIFRTNPGNTLLPESSCFSYLRRRFSICYRLIPLLCYLSAGP